MQSSLLRLAVALLAFGVGVGATMFWIAFRTPNVKRFEAATCRALLPPPPPLPTIEEMPPLPPPPAPRAEYPIVSRGLINDKAISKPAPVYPRAAVALNMSGTVKVKVLVDEDGKVLTAKAVSGAPFMRAAAVDAAYKAVFAPTVLGGEPVRVSGVVTYNFVLP